MCSIAGVLWWAAPPMVQELEALVEGALDLLHRRGPDERSRRTVSPRCVMGGNRLIIRGGRGVGSMPFEADGRTVFFNGEIYNYRLWAPQAATDGEALLPAYAARGGACFREFDGEFAISLWDEGVQTLLLARDPFGSKPLYFSLDDRRLLWASSAAAISRMAPHTPCVSVRGPHYRGIGAPLEPYSSFRGIWQVPPGHVLMAGPAGVQLYAYNLWEGLPDDQEDPSEVFARLEESLALRLDYDGTMAIPFSGGVDSGVIAFMADRLGVRYHLFSVLSMLGRPIPEAAAIQTRLERLRRPTGVTLLQCDEAAIHDALGTMYRPDYYDYEAIDTGNLPAFVVYRAIHEAGLRVAIDGTGGDELFHGYPHRDEFIPLPDWPQPWTQGPGFYAVFTAVPAYAAKADRAGAHYSFETRYPYLSAPLFRAAMRLRRSAVLKWPLRRFLLERLDYGEPTVLDLGGKEGFKLHHADREPAQAAMRQAWCQAGGMVSPPTALPLRFPFPMGVPLPERLPLRS